MAKKKDFYQLEKNIIRLKEKIETFAADETDDAKKKIHQIKEKIPLQTVQIARHPQRPYTLDYLEALTEDFMEIHGDRRSADDPAIVAGLGFYRGRSVAFIGHQKGRTTRQRIARNFGQPNPEGYRKALRVMKMAEKFGIPIVTLIDTPGAYPGIWAEEHGQAEAIANNLREISKLKVPVVNIVIGEGGSGGALAVGVGDAILMLENSFYSVISPEGCGCREPQVFSSGPS
jgi:acetyl-CoA carboxylase carboxyl transferase subunit alpha